ncbi:MAG: Hsp20/alpha crystallin family protein [Candidatus Paceibacterota bacterium]|jgi:HSP20 family protein
MVSFIDKLKKMGMKEPEEKTAETELILEEKPKKERKSKIEKMEIKSIALDDEVVEEKKEKSKEEKIKIQEENTVGEMPSQEEWAGSEEGQLAVDIYQTETDLVIQSAVAGVNAQSIDISLEKDMLTIKGCRRKIESENGDYFSQECFWGPFSREIILPAEVDPEKVMAKMKDGILTIRIPKILREKKRKITVSN